MARNNWSEEELIVAFNLYCKTPFTKINSSNRSVIELAPIIGRSNGAIAMKLANYARLDPALKARGIKGLKSGSKGEIEIWKQFHDDWEGLALRSEEILAKLKNTSLEDSAGIVKDNLPSEGKERQTVVKSRVNQTFFRKMILASYDSKCCITGISNEDLLIASHIKPWSVDEENRMNPANGICLNNLHDKAFDKGLITINQNYEIRVSQKVLSSNEAWVKEHFAKIDGTKITLPQKFFPDKTLLKWHEENVFN